MTDINVDKSLEENDAGLKKLAWALEVSQGRFKLLIARCNYGWWRSHLIEYLQSILEIKNIHLDVLELERGDRNLLHRMEQDFGENQPVALTVVGLENLENLELFLVALNQLRDNFNLKCPFPLLIWLNDDIYRQLVKIAPDFESWSTTRQFPLHQEDLLNFLHYAVEEFFQNTFAPEAGGFYRQLQNKAVGDLQRQELNFAIASLEKNGQVFSASLQTDLQFIQAMEKHGTNEGFQHLEYCQQFWQGETAEGNCLGYCRLKLALVKFYLGAYYLYKDFNAIYENYQKEHPTSDTEQLEYWQTARSLYEESISLFQAENRRDLVGKVIIELERALQRLKLWDELEAVGTEALILHKDYNRQHKLAQDYIFLAEVALEKESYEVSKNLAQKGLDILLADVPVDERWDAGLYYLFLAQAEKHLGNLETSLQYLLTAKDLGDLGHPRIYLRILKELREIYLSQKDYLAAFEIKQLQLEIEHQYGLRSFIGAGYLKSRKQEDNPLNTDKSENIAVEIVNSGRSLDVSRLLDRLASNNSKLIVIHGFSGVGKSSLIKGGLIPALTKEMIGYHKNFPVYVRDYQNWVVELGRSLQNILIESRLFDGNLESLPDILGQLELSESRFLRTVLLFDQFEEFFFSNPEPAQRREFFSFVGNCLRLPDVRVVLSLREDYLHYLLECDRIENMQIFNGDILGKNIRYRLGNFSLADARIVVENLTRSSRASFPADLIEALVADLGKKLGEVRPIELQIVGAQMQTEDVKTLAEYRQQGTLENLVNRYLESVVNDCGEDSQQIAEVLLYVLTDERGTRPRKTREELERDLKDIAQMIPTKEQLDLILTVFVGSGLVMLLPDIPFDRYQLVHDYLAELVRKNQEPRLKHLVEELEEEKRQRKLSESKFQLFLKITIGGLLLFSTGTLFLAWQAVNTKRQVEIMAIHAINNSSESLLKSNEPFDALIESLRSASRLQIANLVQKNDVRIDTIFGINNALHHLNTYRLYNSLEEHIGSVRTVCFSPNGEYLVTGGQDGTVKLWNNQGKLLKTFAGHSNVVNSVGFSPDSQTIASASSDKIVKLWNFEGKLLRNLIGHTDEVNSVIFSNDGKIIISGGEDSTIKLWNLEGKLLQNITDKKGIFSVNISPDGKVIASSGYDKTVKLWNRQGKLLSTLTGHTEEVRSISFSPDGKNIISGSADKTVKLWDYKGKIILNLIGHTDKVNSVSFSPDGKTIASASKDNTVKLWNIEGKLLKNLIDHSGPVLSISFNPKKQTIASASEDGTIKLWHSNQDNIFTDDAGIESVAFSPDGEMVVSGGENYIVKLWNRQGKLLKNLIGHNDLITQVSFSPDGKTIASASKDNKIKLWNTEGKLLNTLNGYINQVYSVKFSPDGNTIISGGDKTIKLWNIEGKLLKNFDTDTIYPHTEEILSVSFSPDGKMIASGSRDKTMKLWNIEGKLLNTITHSGLVSTVGFSPNGKIIISGNGDKTVKLWDVKGKLIKTLSNHTDVVYSAVFSPSKLEIIVSGTKDGVMKIWNSKGKLIKNLPSQTGSINSISFDKDGNAMITASSDKMLKLWELNLNKLHEISCQYLHDYLINHPSILEELTVCQNPTIKKEASSSLIMQGNNLAKQGLTKEAVDKFNQAKEWNSELTFDSIVEAKNLHKSQQLTKEGEELARRLDIEGAIAKFQEVILLDPLLVFEPEDKARQIAFFELISQGRQLVHQNKFQEAVANYKKAENIAKNIQIISARDWNYLCLHGISKNHATHIMFTCEKAVELQPGDWDIRNNRGIARAVNGDITGAIEDFQFVIEEFNKIILNINIDDFKKAKYIRYKLEYKQWINQLKSGKNPFTSEFLKNLPDR